MFDVAIVGAGPAGLAAAIAVRRLGMRVLVVDARTPPIDKACGEGLLPEAVNAARRLGIMLPCEAHPITGIRFLRGARSVEATFDGTAGLGVRRLALSEALVAHACRLGVQISWGTSVTTLEANHLVTSNGKVATRWIVAADGERSGIRRALGLDVPPYSSRFAFRQHFDIPAWTSFVEVHWGPDCQTYVTPLKGQLGIAVISKDSSLRVAQAVARFPSLQQRLDGAQAISVERGAVTTDRALPRVTRGNVALVGDAAGSVDAITGDGVGLAFLQAESLAHSLERGGLADYESGHAALYRRARWMGRALTAGGHRPLLSSIAMSVVSSHPRLFHFLVQFHARPDINFF